MKAIFSGVLVVGFLLSTSVIHAHETGYNENGECSSSEESPSIRSWYDKADQILEAVAGIPMLLCADAEAFRQWTQILLDITTQLTLQEQIKTELLQRAINALKASNQRIAQLEAEKLLWGDYLERLGSCSDTMKDSKRVSSDAIEYTGELITALEQTTISGDEPRS